MSSKKETPSPLVKFEGSASNPSASRNKRSASLNTGTHQNTNIDFEESVSKVASPPGDTVAGHRKNKTEVPSTVRSLNIAKELIAANAKSKKGAQALTAYINSLQQELNKVNRKYEDL